MRQAHPGPDEPPYHSFGEKLRDAQRYSRDEQIPWTVLVDDLQGTVHQIYGGLADPTYLIDREGRIAFYNMWTHVPTLYAAIQSLLWQGGAGVVRGGMTRAPHLGPSLTDGWRALSRGLPQSVSDLMLAGPGTPALIWLGHQLRPLLSPLTLREKPVPMPAKAAVMAGGALAVALGARWILMRRHVVSGRKMLR